jgi:hypothetical protein
MVPAFAGMTTDFWLVSTHFTPATQSTRSGFTPAG